jgi:hypothetical protein
MRMGKDPLQAGKAPASASIERHIRAGTRFRADGLARDGRMPYNAGAA